MRDSATGTVKTTSERSLIGYVDYVIILKVVVASRSSNLGGTASNRPNPFRIGTFFYAYIF